MALRADGGAEPSIQDAVPPSHATSEPESMEGVPRQKIRRFFKSLRSDAAKFGLILRVWYSVWLHSALLRATQENAIMAYDHASQIFP